MLEAHACGTPVVVPRAQGFVDTVNHGVSDMLFDCWYTGCRNSGYKAIWCWRHRSCAVVVHPCTWYEYMFVLTLPFHVCNEVSCFVPLAACNVRKRGVTLCADILFLVINSNSVDVVLA